MIPRTLHAPTSRDGVSALVNQVAERNASELHLKVPHPPMLRIGDTLVPAGTQVLAPADTSMILEHLAALAGVAVPHGAHSLEFSFGLVRVGRFHVFAYRQRGSIAIMLRRMELQIPSLSSMSLGPDVDQLPPGLTLVVGRDRLRGLHAVIGRYNQRRAGNVCVLEAPLTFLHKDAAAAVSQREVGLECASYASGIHDAVRLKVDLLAVADLPDREAIDATLSAAEQELRVVVAIGAPDEEHAAWWILRRFEGIARADTEMRLQRALRGVLSPAAVPELRQAPQPVPLAARR